MKDDKKIIMYDSPEAAKFTTGISGWVSSTGHFCDVMHEDQTVDDIDDDIIAAVDELNELISAAKPLIYHEGDKAVKI